MAKAKYSIIDDNGNNLGFVVIEKAPESQQFQHAISAVPMDGPLADVVLFLGVLGGFTGAALLFDAPGWVAPGLGIGLTATLAGIKAWRGGFELPEQDSDILIKAEFKSDDGTLYLDEITDRNIRLPVLGRLCQTIEWHNFVWLGRGKAKIFANVSRDQHDRIREQFSRLGYFRAGDGGQIEMAARGRLFVRKVSELHKKSKI